MDELSDILEKLESLNKEIFYQADVCRLELEARLRLGLAGMDAVDHYNFWMRNAGLFHLVVS